MDDSELSFENIFSALIKFSETFEIKYDYKVFYYKEQSSATYSIANINGESYFLFKRRLATLSKEGFINLNEAINQIPYEERIDFLKEIHDGMSGLKHRVKEKVVIYEENEFGPREEHKFNSFVNFILKPLSVERTHGDEKSILRISRDYADSWLNIINENSRKVEFLINQYELMPEPKSAIKDKNTISIFYSWQSDIDDERKFIWKGLRALKEDLSKKGKNLVVESDMRGISGSQDIPNTLFNKIKEVDIFLADVNLVGLSIYRADEIPNANVMIELGYAAASLGWDRVILAMNTKNHKIEQLPFDIRQRSILWYNADDFSAFEKKLLVFIEAIVK